MRYWYLSYMQNSSLCMLGNFACFLSSADIFFQNQLFLKNSFHNTIKVSNSLDPNQSRDYVGPDLGPNCLQKFSLHAG